MTLILVGVGMWVGGFLTALGLLMTGHITIRKAGKKIWPVED